ncbi:hypothetical protein [Sphingomonas nostoxanthinifaciens]|uniref:hypothetical protein n=1 Tax=Sphingomonas nostoxanthinifaciens TaxID=2872652 RepID=UPI001CC22009|nr:hypothetical protein [Sphingomonas nostoxanthinifaciens]UAK25086.1 hypothetical protein K8P63_02410 [Sphingomonas nostoxanthinifaciens]
MKTMFAALAVATIATAPLALPAPAVAQNYNHDRSWQGDRDGQWDPSQHYDNRRYGSRRLSENDRVYRGGDGRYYCKRSNGTTGLVLGAVGGGVLGNVLGGGTLGTLLGAGGGALLGKNLDQNHDRAQNRRNGYRCQ